MTSATVTMTAAKISIHSSAPRPVGRRTPVITAGRETGGDVPAGRPEGSGARPAAETDGAPPEPLARSPLLGVSPGGGGPRGRRRGAWSRGSAPAPPLAHPTTLQVTPGTCAAGASGVPVADGVDVSVWVRVTVGVSAVTVDVTAGGVGAGLPAGVPDPWSPLPSTGLKPCRCRGSR